MGRQCDETAMFENKCLIGISKWKYYFIHGFVFRAVIDIWGGGGQGFPPTMRNVIPSYFHTKIEEKLNL